MDENNRQTPTPSDPNATPSEQEVPTSEQPQAPASEQESPVSEQIQSPAPGSNPTSTGKKPSIPAIACLAVSGVLLILAVIFLFLSQQHQTPSEPVISEPVVTEPEDDSPTDTTVDDPIGDTLFISVERQEYESGDLTLIIPVLDKTLTVYDGTDTATLLKGACLYEYAQLPGEGDRNVSIAAHRNGLHNGQITDSAPFYYIDTIAEGDYLYLVDDEYIYRYLYEETVIVEQDDWTPIYTQGYSCLTLTSCTPIGISDHRIIVRGRLDKIIPYTADYDYPSNENALTD